MTTLRQIDMRAERLEHVLGVGHSLMRCKTVQVELQHSTMASRSILMMVKPVCRIVSQFVQSRRISASLKSVPNLQMAIE